MFYRKPVISYSGKALESWMERLSFDWEKLFTKEQIIAGRNWYKTCKVHSIEVDAFTATAHLKISADFQPYCVIDLEKNTLSFRSSDDDKNLTMQLCCCALYEIEELIASSLDSIPLNDEDVEAPAIQESEPKEEKKTVSKDFVLSFSTKRKGLAFSCYWKGEKNKRILVYGNNSMDFSVLSDDAREQLVRLASFARKAGFEYEKNLHILKDITKIPFFVSSGIANWRKHFHIEKEDDIDKFALGERFVNLEYTLDKTKDKNSFDLAWNLRLGGEKLSENILQKLTNSHTLIIPNYGIVSIEEDDVLLYKQIESARDKVDNSIPFYLLLSLFSDTKILKNCPAFENAKIEFENTSFDISSLPEFLRDYQKRGVAWAKKLFSWNCAALLSDEMGLGKTAQTLTLVDTYCKENGKAIVVCPASVIPVWISECEKFFPNIKCGILGANFDIENDKSTLILASYTQLRRTKNIWEKTNFELAVLDEAQFIKNPDAKTTITAMSIKSSRKIALTGTPIENKLLDLWTIFKWLMPYLLPERSIFNYPASELKILIDKTRGQIAPFCLRREKKEVANELPEKIYSDLLCPLSPLQKSEYDKLLNQAQSEIADSNFKTDSKKRMSILALLTRLRQISCDAGLLPWVDCQTNQSGKICALSDKIEEIFHNGKKILVFSQFTSLLTRIRSHISQKYPELSIYELTGTTKNRALPVQGFQKHKGSALILVSLRAGGTGITLTEADYVFFMDPWWNPAVEEQAVDRVHRIGRKGEVVIYKMVAKNTVEDSVRKLQIAKKELFNDIFMNLKDVSNSENFAQTLSLILNTQNEQIVSEEDFL